jgi:hypothetical protein
MREPTGYTATDRQVRVVYIMGDGRSGSTVTGIILGNHPAISSNGELHKWARYRGHPKRDNDKEEDLRFWAEVRKCYRSQGLSTDFSHLQNVQGEVENYGRFPKLLLHRVSPEVCAEYCTHVGGVFKAISAVSRRDIIVDEAKRPARGLALLRCPGCNVRIIHLVRDPRGVVWSQGKRTVEHKFKSPLVAALHYSSKNLMSLLVQLFAPRGRVLRVRYEDLVRQPADQLKRIGQFLGLSMEPVIDKIDAGEPLQVPYLLDGNRIRREKEIQLRFDDTWRKQQSLGNRLVAILFTFPFFVLFGYWNYPYDS